MRMNMYMNMFSWNESLSRETFTFAQEGGKRGGGKGNKGRGNEGNKGSKGNKGEKRGMGIYISFRDC